jgi:tRNA(Met) C34 N-acetyltransferase TmcA
MIKALNNEDSDVVIKDKNWIKKYSEDFKKRFISLLSYEFRDLEVGVSLGVLDPDLSLNTQSDINNMKLIPRVSSDCEKFIEY